MAMNIAPSLPRALAPRPVHKKLSSHAHGRTMGTEWTVTVVPELPIEQEYLLRRAIQACLDDLCDQMSHWQSDSLISRINQAETGWYALPDDFFQVLYAGLELAKATQGAYDPTLGELSNLWGFGPEHAHSLPPAAELCSAAVMRSGWQRTELSITHQAIWQPGGLQFDLSSIAKGYAVDKIAKLLDSQAIEHYLIEIGGEVKAKGCNASEQAWRVHIELPQKNVLASANNAQPQCFPATVSNHAMATSGNYRREYSRNGAQYCHTLDPTTGQPVHHALRSVTVIHERCVMADALATALLVMGPQAAMRYALAHDIAALFMQEQDTGGQIDWTPRFQELATLVEP